MARCKHWLPAKRRPCGMTAKAGDELCPHHLPAAAALRVPCPLDPRHTVPPEDLARHVSRTCPTLRLQRLCEAQAFFCRDINAGAEADPLGALAREGETRTATRVRHAAELEPEAFEAFLARVERAWQQECRGWAPPLSVLCPPACAALMRVDHLRPFSEKHAEQQASIAGHLQHFGLLQDLGDLVVVELGAGRGYLGEMLVRGLGVSRLALVDRAGMQYKADRTLRPVPGLAFERVRVDLKDFRVGGLRQLQRREASLAEQSADQEDNSPGGPGHSSLPPAHIPDGRPRDRGEAASPSAAVQPAARDASQAGERHDECPAAQELDSRESSAAAPRAWVAAGKHLCGAATDFALRACMQQEGDREGVRCRGLGIAPCCQHRCAWQHYLNPRFIAGLGLSPLDFELMCWMTGWAACGHGRPLQGEDAPDPGSEEEAAGAAEGQHSEKACQDSCAHPARDLSRERRKLVGQRCKDLIDLGRLRALQAQAGWEARAVLYVGREVSGENRLLLARNARCCVGEGTGGLR